MQVEKKVASRSRPSWLLLRISPSAFNPKQILPASGCRAKGPLNLQTERENGAGTCCSEDTTLNKYRIKVCRNQSHKTMPLWPADNVLKLVTTKPRNRFLSHTISKLDLFLNIFISFCSMVNFRSVVVVVDGEELLEHLFVSFQVACCFHCICAGHF